MSAKCIFILSCAATAGACSSSAREVSSDAAVDDGTTTDVGMQADSAGRDAHGEAPAQADSAVGDLVSLEAIWTKINGSDTLTIGADCSVRITRLRTGAGTSSSTASLSKSDCESMVVFYRRPDVVAALTPPIHDAACHGGGTDNALAIQTLRFSDREIGGMEISSCADSGVLPYNVIRDDVEQKILTYFGSVF